MSRLVIESMSPHSLMLMWADEEDTGATVGQEHTRTRSHEATAKYCRAKMKKLLDTESRTPAMFEEFEYFAVEVAIAEYAGKNRDAARYEDGAWCFETQRAASAALKIANGARRAAKVEWENTTPMPGWAVQATAAGWKPPKGWKP